MPVEKGKTTYTQLQKAVLHVLKNGQGDEALLAAVERNLDPLAVKMTERTQLGLEKAQAALKKIVIHDAEELYKKVEELWGKRESEVEGREQAFFDRLEQGLAEIEAKTNVSITVDDKAKGTSKKMEGLFHKDFPKLVKLIETGNPLVLTGPTQSGKSKSLGLAAEVLGREVYFHSFGPTQTETALAGFNSATGAFVFRNIYLAAKYGGMWIGDEADVVRDAGVLIWFNNAVSNGDWSFPIGIKAEVLALFEQEKNYKEVEAIKGMAGGNFKSHPDFRIALTMNTAGNGGNMTYSGRGRIDKSTLARFDFLYWGYDEKLERALVMKYAPSKDALKWVAFCQAVRIAVAEDGVDDQVIISPSHTLRGAKNLAAGFEWDEVINLSLLPVDMPQGKRESILSRARVLAEGVGV